MPCWNSGGNVASDSAGTPIASSPAKLRATPSDTGRPGSNEETGSSSGISRRSSSRAACRSSMRNAQYAPAYGFGRGIRAAAWMSPSSSEVSVSVVMVLLR